MEAKMTEEQWHIDLQEKGYAIIPDVLDSEECLVLENGYWNFWKRLSGGRLLKDKPKSWKTVFDFAPLHGMLCQHFSIGHMQEIWNLRSHERVKSVFETIWGTDDLVVSFDGAATSFAPEVTGKGWHHKNWLHLDQAPSRNELECVQGWVTADNVGPGDATLVVLEGSHKLHAQFAQAFGQESYERDWLKLTPEQEAWYREQGCKEIAVECPKGSMVLWDSRTVHAGRGPLHGRKSRRNRYVAYVCMLPSDHLKPGEREIKMRACLEGRLTSHWPAGRVRLFDKNPRTYGNQSLPENIPEYDPPHFTHEQARLAGWLNPEECPLTIEDRDERLGAIELALEKIHKSERMNAKAISQLIQSCSGAPNKLKPTATVVRDGRGRVKVERSSLLSDTEKAERVSTSVAAGLKRKNARQNKGKRNNDGAQFGNKHEERLREIELALEKTPVSSHHGKSNNGKNNGNKGKSNGKRNNGRRKNKSDF